MFSVVIADTDHVMNRVPTPWSLAAWASVNCPSFNSMEELEIKEISQSADRAVVLRFDHQQDQQWFIDRWL